MSSQQLESVDHAATATRIRAHAPDVHRGAGRLNDEFHERFIAGARNILQQDNAQGGISQAAKEQLRSILDIHLSNQAGEDEALTPLLRNRPARSAAIRTLH